MSMIGGPRDQILAAHNSLEKADADPRVNPAFIGIGYALCGIALAIETLAEKVGEMAVDRRR